MRIGLVTHVPDDDVAWGVEHVVQGDGELHHAEARAQVAACLGDGVDGLGAQFVGQLMQLRNCKCARIGGGLDGVEQRG